MYLKFCSRKGYPKAYKVFPDASFLSIGYDSFGDPCFDVYGFEGLECLPEQLSLFHWRLTTCTICGVGGSEDA